MEGEKDWDEKKWLCSSLSGLMRISMVAGPSHGHLIAGDISTDSSDFPIQENAFGRAPAASVLSWQRIGIYDKVLYFEYALAK